jgi:hypothetical protein
MTVHGGATRPTDRRLAAALLGVLALALWAAPAQAERPLLSSRVVSGGEVPGGGIEGACGIAVTAGNIYVSDYYHHAVDVFTRGGGYLSQIPGDPLDGPCALATSPNGALYANDWHEGVERLLPSALGFDEAESTGVAVDPASGDVYVDDRTYVAVYEPSGAAVLAEGVPLRIGAGSLGDGYGLAIAAGRVYVPDAVDDTVKVYEPATDVAEPVATIDGAATPQGGFSSLVDAAVAIDPGNGHLLVLDNLQPGFEHPEAAIDEFDAAGTFAGQVAQRLVDGEPSGLALSDGKLYATSGNDEGATVLEFGPYTATSLLGGSAGGEGSSARAETAAPPPAAFPTGPAAARQALRLLPPQSSAKGASAIIRVVLPGPGTLAAAGPGLRAVRSPPLGAGRRALHLRLNRAGKRALARAKLRKLKVKVRIAFAPTDGPALSARETVTFRAKGFS